MVFLNFRVAGDISPVFPRRTPIIAQTRSTSSSACGVRCRRESSLEAGDEEIDWNHTRMLSLGFFPSISTDQVIYSVFHMASITCYIIVYNMIFTREQNRFGTGLGVGLVLPFIL